MIHSQLRWKMKSSTRIYKCVILHLDCYNVAYCSQLAVPRRVNPAHMSSIFLSVICLGVFIKTYVALDFLVCLHLHSPWKLDLSLFLSFSHPMLDLRFKLLCQKSKYRKRAQIKIKRRGNINQRENVNCR